MIILHFYRFPLQDLDLFGIRSDGEEDKPTLSSLVLETKIPPVVGLPKREPRPAPKASRGLPQRDPRPAPPAPISKEPLSVEEVSLAT